MRRMMAALLSIAGIAGVTVTTAAAMVPIVVEVGALPIAPVSASIQRDDGAVAVASDRVDITARGGEQVHPETVGAEAIAGGFGLRLTDSARGDTALSASGDATRPITGATSGLVGWEAEHLDDHVLQVDRGAVVTALPAAVFTLGAMIAALGLSPYRRPVV